MPDLPSLHAIPRRLRKTRRNGVAVKLDGWYVGRPSLFANPFQRRPFKHARSVELHRAWLEGRISALGLERLGFCPSEVDTLLRLRARVRRALPRLRGMHLICWCPLNSRWCHADTLLRLANVPIIEHAGRAETEGCRPFASRGTGGGGGRRAFDAAAPGVHQDRLASASPVSLGQP